MSGKSVDGFAIQGARHASPPSLTRPLCFERTEVLFKASDYTQSYNIELDRVQSGMLDGRTIHFHVQFVEPELLVEYPEANAHSQASGIPTFSPVKLIESIVETPLEISCAMLVSVNGCCYQVYASSDYQEPIALRVHSVLNELNKFGLDWLPELALGAFVCTCCDLGGALYTATIDTSVDVDLTTIAVIDASARSLTNMWLHAEASCGGQSGDLTNAARLFAGEAFSSLMIAEYRHRAGFPDALMQALDAREQILADFPLTRHLINFWDRRWNRQAFLSGSVFDYASNLRDLYEDWRL